MALSQLLEPDRRYMRSALQQAELAKEKGEVPVGAVIVQRGQIVGRGHNLVESLRDPTAHAEMIAITAACETLQSKTLTGCTMYVTLEPCPMCAGAIVLSKLDRLCFGAFDAKAGSASTLYNIPQDPRLNHQVDIVSGIEADRAEELLRGFFQELRDTS
ncbi:MAG: tRNA adenosine(34) deaminase TadA [Bacteroidetes bacterium]|nr:tRNA adenosine(34) deaminase TadA [Bacteroidota bacterium]MCY4204184.1 tRNA adenosine(34) deaminase TadA [Bacteroidota bacterium]